MIKHIRMPKAIAEAWLSDLRSNPKQGRYSLKDSKGGHCCLGRLQVVVSGDVERNKDGESLQVPSLEWLEKNNIEFLGWDGTPFEAPYCIEKGTYFSGVNDDRVPFSEIADLLEAEIEYND